MCCAVLRWDGMGWAMLRYDGFAT
eukprot:COSAG06_NODE_44826_length_360_cov_0.670498_1_plen_23_part_10